MEVDLARRETHTQYYELRPRRLESTSDEGARQTLREASTRPFRSAT